MSDKPKVTVYPPQEIPDWAKPWTASTPEIVARAADRPPGTPIDLTINPGICGLPNKRKPV